MQLWRRSACWLFGVFESKWASTIGGCACQLGRYGIATNLRLPSSCWCCQVMPGKHLVCGGTSEGVLHLVRLPSTGGDTRAIRTRL